MPARMTSTAYGQGAKNALVCSAGMLIVWLVGGFATQFATGKPIGESFGIAFALIFVVIYLWFFGPWLFRRRTGGQILLDCGPHPTRKLFLLNAVLFLFFFVIGGVATSPRLPIVAIGGPIFGITTALYWAVMATGRLQIREAGLWTYWGLMRWEKIGSRSWASDSTLFIKGKGWSANLFCGALPVPPEQQKAFDELLQQHCPNQPVA